MDKKDILACYQRMREAGYSIQKILPGMLSRETIKAAALKLKMWEDGSIVFDDDRQLTVLFDFAIYQERAQGRNAVDVYTDKHPPAPGSDEEAVLAAMRRAYHSAFQVLAIEPEVGVHVQDLLRLETRLLADIGFGTTAVTGLVLACHVIPFEDFIMTTGAALPMNVETLEALADELDARRLLPEKMASLRPAQQAGLAATIIKLCLDAGANAQIDYIRP